MRFSRRIFGRWRVLSRGTRSGKPRTVGRDYFASANAGGLLTAQRLGRSRPIAGWRPENQTAHLLSPIESSGISAKCSQFDRFQSLVSSPSTFGRGTNYGLVLFVPIGWGREQ